MRFLVDRCAGGRLAVRLREQGHDVVESRDLGPDPGDRALLEHAAAEDRILVTIDVGFGKLIFVETIPHAGMVLLPDVPSPQRIALMAEVLARCGPALAGRAVVTVRGGRIRVSPARRP